MKLTYVGLVSTGMGDRVRVEFLVRGYISVCNQLPRSTQPGHPFVGRRRKDYGIGTLHYNWPMSVHASQAFSMYISVRDCTDSEHLPGVMCTSQRAVTPCGWAVKAGMVRVWVAGKTV